MRSSYLFILETRFKACRSKHERFLCVRRNDNDHSLFHAFCLCRPSGRRSKKWPHSTSKHRQKTDVDSLASSGGHKTTIAKIGKRNSQTNKAKIMMSTCRFGRAGLYNPCSDACLRRNTCFDSSRYESETMTKAVDGQFLDLRAAYEPHICICVCVCLLEILNLSSESRS